MNVVAARQDDCEALAEIHVRSWQAAYAGLFPDAYLASLSIPERAERWKAIFAAAQSRTFVAREESRLTGSISFARCRDAGASPDRGEIWALYVAPQAWSTGVGRALWETARVQLLHAGFAEASLWVLSGNRRGIRFYEGVGFERESGSEKTFEQGGATLEEVRLVHRNLSAGPAMERLGRC